MRSLVLALALLTLPAHAAARASLTDIEKGLLRQMAESMERQLRRAHAKAAGSPYAKPEVRLDVAERQIVITNRFRHNPSPEARRAIKRSLKDRVPQLCTALQSPPIRRTGLALVVREEMRSGSLIATASASANEC